MITILGRSQAHCSILPYFVLKDISQKMPLDIMKIVKYTKIIHTNNNPYALRYLGKHSMWYDFGQCLHIANCIALWVLFSTLPHSKHQCMGHVNGIPSIICFSSSPDLSLLESLGSSNFATHLGWLKCPQDGLLHLNS